MRRREFIAGLGSAAVQPLAARAQQPAPARRIGVLVGGAIESAPDTQQRNAAFAQTLQQLGWTNGDNVRIDYRYGLGNAANVRKYAAELVSLAPDVILASGASVLAPLLQATRTLPIVFVAVVDPVGAGFVESMAQPGGNATGFIQFEYSLSGKWLELLKAIAPSVTRAAILRDPVITTGVSQFAVISIRCGWRPDTSTASSEVRSLPICRCRRRPNTNSSSISRPLRRWPRRTGATARARRRGDRMRRRDVVTLLGGARLLPIRAAFPQADRMRRVGVLMAIVETDPQADARARAFLQGLRDLGWTEGRNLVIDMRWGRGQPDRIRALAAELVALKPDVILAVPASAVPALQRETKTIPIVFAQTPDPVALGLVESLARPGGNMTGFALYELAIGGKWLELLKQIAPPVARVAVLHDPRLPSATGYVRAITQAAPSFGSEVVPLAARNAAEIERIIDEFAREKTDGLIVPPSSLAVAHRELIITLAARHRLPTVYAHRYYVASGGLASYGIDNIPEYRQAAAYVGRILKGEKPGDLPVQYADSKFELAINLKTARTLGLEIPVSLLARTDEVIEWWGGWPPCGI